jgi:hypothetical protein
MFAVAEGAVEVDAPSPLEGEGISDVQRKRMGEGFVLCVPLT